MRGDPTADAFGYNDRGEVTAASIMGWSPSPATASYGYDGIVQRRDERLHRQQPQPVHFHSL